MACCIRDAFLPQNAIDSLAVAEQSLFDFSVLVKLYLIVSSQGSGWLGLAVSILAFQINT